MKYGTVAYLVVMLPALAACGGHREPAEPRSFGPIYSPNGEPLNGGRLGHPSCPEALAAWFDRTDVNRAGTIDLAMFLADARRQFAAMDIDHDGQLTSDELTRYRAAFVGDRGTEVATDDDTLRPDQITSPTNQGKTGGRSGGGERGGSRGLPGETAGVPHPSRPASNSNSRDRLRDRPDPVMIADVTMRGRVSLTEFLAYERQNFSELDTNHDGRLSKGELAASCPKP